MLAPCCENPPTLNGFVNKNEKIFIAGHRGTRGQCHLRRKLQQLGFTRLIGKTRAELDLLDAKAVAQFFADEKPEYVFDAAAKVGGIHANDTYPAEFLYQNLQIQNHLIHSAYLAKVKKFLFLGSSCIYPKFAPQPMKEDSLLTGALEPSNQWHAVAKNCRYQNVPGTYRREYKMPNFISAPCPQTCMAPNDNYDLQNSHVLPALIRKFHDAKVSGAPRKVVCWGRTGSPFREFLYSDDLLLKPASS